MALLKKIKQGLMSSLRSKIGALLAKPALKGLMKEFDLSAYGGAPMLGLTGLVVKTHGSSDAAAIKNSIVQCIAFSQQDIPGKIRERLGTKKDETKKAVSEKDA